MRGVGGTHASIDGSLVRDTSGSARNGAFRTAVTAYFGADEIRDGDLAVPDTSLPVPP
jgi:hypothetical protein